MSEAVEAVDAVDTGVTAETQESPDATAIGEQAASGGADEAEADDESEVTE